MTAQTAKLSNIIVERINDDPTIIASAELPRKGRDNEPRHMYVHQTEKGVSFSLELDPTNYEDVVGTEAHNRYLDMVYTRGRIPMPPGYMEGKEANKPSLMKRTLGRLGIVG